MQKSRYNQIIPIKNNQYAIFNPLSGAFDIADEEEKNRLENNTPKDLEEKNYWLKRGYYFENKKEEEKYIQKRYLEFLAETKNNTMQFILVFNYLCNFHCFYCYEYGITNQNIFTEEMLSAFLRFTLDYREKNKRKIAITLFGGEPLLPNNQHLIEKIVSETQKHNLALSIVSNGFYLEQFIPLLKQTKIIEIQVTLDGDKEIHDKRRFEKQQEGSFEKILQAVKQAIHNQIPIHIRLIVDKETLPSFVSLAQRLEKENLLGLPSSQLKFSLGRNYELIYTSPKKEILYSLDEMFEQYAELSYKHPILKKLFQPSFFGIKQIALQKTAYLPNFDSCPAGKHELAFDASGKIYGCTASCGRENYAIGQYYPDIQWDNEKLTQWQKRSILTIPECKECSLGVICGGGCGVLAYEKNHTILSPNCKPIDKILKTGVQYYQKYW